MAKVYGCCVTAFMLCVVSCSHYVGLTDPLVMQDRRPDTLRTAFLAIRATTDYQGSGYTVSLSARKGRNGPRLESIVNATLFVNSVRWDLKNGFPYGNDELRVGGRMPVISIGYVSPERLTTGVDVPLDPMSSFKMAVKASRTTGLNIEVSPPIRESETIEVIVYKMFGVFSEVAKRTFKGVGTTQLTFKPSDLAGAIDGDPKIGVQVQRVRVEYGPYLFSDGIELTQIVGPFEQIVSVSP